MSRFLFSQTGFGFDAHDFSESGRLKLGGITFENLPSLKGHSDGDSLIHALIDALLGGAGAGDIGELFPDTSVQFKGVSSLLMLDEALKAVKKKGWMPFFIDVTVVADRPRLSGYKTKIGRLLAGRLGLPMKSVNIKAKTSEGTRLLSERGGIAAWAVATLVPIKKK